MIANIAISVPPEEFFVIVDSASPLLKELACDLSHIEHGKEFGSLVAGLYVLLAGIEKRQPEFENTCHVARVFLRSALMELGRTAPAGIAIAGNCPQLVDSSAKAS
jgi:hypothetical protein